MKIGELFIALGFDVDDKKLKGFDDNLKSVRNTLFKISAVATGTLFAINSFVDGSVRAATALRNFNNETGNSIESLQKWQVASVLTNSAASADQVTSSFYAMSQAIADVTMGKGGGGFAMLGVSDVRGMDVSEVMEELRRNFDTNINKWGYAQTINLMRDIGLDPAMINAIKLTNKEFKKLVKGKFLDPSSQKKLVDLGDAFSKLKWDMRLFKDQISADISPKLIEMIDKAIPLLKDFGSSIKAVYDELKKLWEGLNPEDQKLILLFFGGLLVILNPIATAIGIIVAGFWDLGRAIRGLPTISGGILNKLGTWFKEDGGGFYGEYRRRQASMRNSLSPTSNSSNNKTSINASNINNTFHIISNSDPNILAELIAVQQKQSLNPTLADQNKGVRY